MNTITHLKGLWLWLCMFTFATAIGQTTQTIELTVDSMGGSSNLGNGTYNSGAERLWNQDEINFGGKYITAGNGSNVGTIQTQANNGVIYNITALPGRLVSITLQGTSASATSKLYVAGENASRLVNDVAGNVTVSGTEFGSALANGTWTIPTGSDYHYFAIKRQGTAQYFNKITIVYEEPQEPVDPDQPWWTTTPSASTLEFNAVVGQSSQQAIQVNYNLLADGVSALVDNEAFSVAVEDDLTGEATITVTFAPTFAGLHAGELTLLSELGEITFPLQGEANLDALTATAASNISTTAFQANWTATNAYVNDYKVYVFEGAASANVEAVEEDFNHFTSTGGNDGQWSGSVASSKASQADLPGWVINEQVYKGNGAAKLGSSGDPGNLKTPQLGAEGDFTVHFRAGAWNGSNEQERIRVEVEGEGTLSQTVVNVVKGAFTTHTLTLIGANAATRIVFRSYNNSNSRFFLDDVAVIQSGMSPIPVATFTTDEPFVLVTDLTPNTTYTYFVAAVSNGIESALSNGIEVTTAFDPSFAISEIAVPSIACVAEEFFVEIQGLPAQDIFTVNYTKNGIAYAQEVTTDAAGYAAFLENVANEDVVLTIVSIERNLPAYTLEVNQTYTIHTAVMQTYYVDADGDGYGDDSLPTIQACAQPAGYAAVAGDCNDNAALVNPGMSEILYNGIDDNCDGNLDEGHQVTTRVISAQCGTTLSAVTTTIHVNSNSRATAYRFKVYNMTTQEENIIERTTNYFGLADLPMGGTYGTTYRVSAELQYYGIWLGYYGEECYVSTPPHINDAQGSTTTCDTQLEAITSIVHTYAGTNVEYYRFKFTHYDENNEEVVEIVDRERPWINFSTLATAKYGTTYMVEVATKLRSSASYSAYAAPCIIISPDVPAIESCGAQAATSNTTFLVQTAAQVRSWRFELTNMETFETMTIVRPIRYIRFVDMPNYQPGAEYGIRVAVMTNGNWSPYGPACSVWAPMTAARQDIATTQFEVAAYPNTFDNDFRLKVTLPTQDRVEVRMFDMLGKQVDARVLEAAEVEYAYFGKNIPAGVYNVVVTQGTEVKTVRVIRK